VALLLLHLTRLGLHEGIDLGKGGAVFGCGFKDFGFHGAGFVPSDLFGLRKKRNTFAYGIEAGQAF